MNKLLERHRKLFKKVGIIIIILSLPAVINIPIMLSQGNKFEFDMLISYLGLIFGIRLLGYKF